MNLPFDLIRIQHYFKTLFSRKLYLNKCTVKIKEENKIQQLNKQNLKLTTVMK